MKKDMIGDIISIKLLNGLDVLGTLESVTDDGNYVLHAPLVMTLMPSKTEPNKMESYIQPVEAYSAEAPNEMILEFEKSNVLYCYKVNESIINNYKMSVESTAPLYEEEEEQPEL